MKEQEFFQQHDLVEIVTKNIGAGLAIISPEYKTIWANDVIKSIYGDTVGKTCHTTYNQQARICPWCGVRQVFEQNKKHVVTQTVGHDQEGNQIFCEIVATPIFDGQGKIRAALELVLPITERVEKEKTFNELLTFSKTLTSTVDLPELYRKVTGLSKRLLRFDASTLMILSRDKKSLVIEDTIGFPAAMIGTFALVQGQGLSTHVVLTKKAAVVHDFIEETRFEVPPVVFEKGFTSALSVPMMIGNEVFGVLIGHTVRKHAFSEEEIKLYQSFANQAAVAIKNAMHLESLRVSEAKFRTIFESTNDAIMIYNAENGSLVEVNTVACRRLGYNREELLSLSPEKFIAPQFINLLAERIARVRSQNETIFETGHLAKDGTVIPIELSCKLIEFNGMEAILGIARDISERKKIEEERLKAQKLESIGVLAGGIAHDFNNLLAGIIGNTTLARLVAPPGSEICDKLIETEKAAVRARDLTQQLLTFSKGGAPIKKSAAIGDLIRESADFAIRGTKSACRYDLPEDLWLANADTGQLSQVFQNLAINAVHAMPQGGTIAISAANRRLEHREVGLLPFGEYLCITISDQGSGIPAEHLAKIFDPYFTTKERGSGLGLAVVYSIVRNHNGHINVQSRPGHGSTFAIYLPATDKPVARSTHEAPSAPLTGQGRILIMDDEIVVRNITTAFAQKLGYEPQSVNNGEEALAAYQQAMEEGNPFALVIMDLTIPGGLGGKETIAKLLELDPDARAIVSSGYANDPIMANYRKYGFCGVAPKPMGFQEFSEILKQSICPKK